jgi:hypothetical protein
MIALEPAVEFVQEVRVESGGRLVDGGEGTHLGGGTPHSFSEDDVPNVAPVGFAVPVFLGSHRPVGQDARHQVVPLLVAAELEGKIDRVEVGGSKREPLQAGGGLEVTVANDLGSAAGRDDRGASGRVVS